MPPRLRIIIGLMLMLATVAAYSPVWHHHFINFDDGKYVELNPQVQAGLTLSSVAWAFTTGHCSNWHPLTWLSHILDYQLYGLKPGGHHLTNLLLHLANTLLLFAVLRRLTGALWRSAIVAALFALHPLHVESVAWISERKDVLSTCFFLLTIWAYANYTKAQSSQLKAQANLQTPTPAHRELGALKFGLPLSFELWALSLPCFALALMSKPMVVTLPFVLLLLDYWPLKRVTSISYRTLILEKIPFFALTVISCVITFLVQRKGGAVVQLATVPTEMRLGNALISYLRYLGKMIWPVDLAVFYPFPPAWAAWKVMTAVIALVAITMMVILLRRQARYLAFGWFWYVGTLVPVIGLVQVGGQSMADRYTYIPLIGVFVAIVWGLGELTTRNAFGRSAAGVLALVVILTCGWQTRKQVAYWYDSERLFRHTLAVAPSALAHDNLALALLARSEFSEAKFHFESTLKLQPDNANALSNLGTIYGREGNLNEAIRCFQEASRYEPTNAIARHNWGLALANSNRPTEAQAHFREAIRLDPAYADAHNGLAWLQATYRDATVRDGAEALRLAKRAVELTGGTNAVYLDTLAAAQAEIGLFPDAVLTAQKALDSASTDQAMTAQIRARLKLFQAHQPYRE